MNKDRREREDMPKRKSSGKMGIILAVISAIPAILAIVRAMKESRDN